jgi:hypothetical protein
MTNPDPAVLAACPFCGAPPQSIASQREQLVTPVELDTLRNTPSQPSEGWKDAIEAAAKVAEQWNGETADGNTIFIAEAIRALNPPLPEPPATPEKQGGGMG